jgi:hypothetical protein
MEDAISTYFSLASCINSLRCFNVISPVANFLSVSIILVCTLPYAALISANFFFCFSVNLLFDSISATMED